jgi:hypothetical protein
MTLNVGLLYTELDLMTEEITALMEIPSQQLTPLEASLLKRFVKDQKDLQDKAKAGFEKASEEMQASVKQCAVEAPAATKQ